jgi:L-lysine 6-transaminase
MKIAPNMVHETIGKHMLADGFDLVYDIEKSKGMYLHNAKTGRQMLDFFSFFASNPIGYNHPRIVEPEFMKKLAMVASSNVTNSDIYTCEMAEFVETFSRLAMPKYLNHLFFVAGGALGIENTLKTAFDWKVRKNFSKGYKKEVGTKVIHMEQAFHGRTGYTLSLTNTADPRKYQYFPKFKWPRVLNPKARYPLEGKNLQDTIAAEKKSLEQIGMAIDKNKDDIAAFIMEPIQGEGGDNHFRNEYFVAVEKLVHKNDIMLIFDEVQTGVGLTGKMWAHQNYDAVPDMIAFGKKTQVCGMIAGPKVDEIEDNVFKVPSRLNSTWGGNLIDMVRAQRYFEVIEEEHLVENAKKVGTYLLKGIQELQTEYPEFMSNSRGKGLMCAFDTPKPELRGKLLQEIYNRDMIILPSGENSVRFRPSLNIENHDIDKGLDIIRKSIKVVVKGNTYAHDHAP